jgi:hypothetical protein
MWIWLILNNISLLDRIWSLWLVRFAHSLRNFIFWIGRLIFSVSINSMFSVVFIVVGNVVDKVDNVEVNLVEVVVCSTNKGNNKITELLQKERTYLTSCWMKTICICYLEVNWLIPKISACRSRIWSSRKYKYRCTRVYVWFKDDKHVIWIWIWLILQNISLLDRIWSLWLVRFAHSLPNFIHK